MTMSDVRDSPEFPLSCHCYDGVMVPIGNLESAHMNSKQPTTLLEVRAQIISLITSARPERPLCSAAQSVPDVSGSQLLSRDAGRVRVTCH